MGGNAHTIQCNTKTSCKYVILEMKKKMKLANDAYFSIYDVTTEDLWWDQTARYMLGGTEKLQDVTSRWQTSDTHVLMFRRRKLVPHLFIVCAATTCKCEHPNTLNLNSIRSIFFYLYSFYSIKILKQRNNTTTKQQNNETTKQHRNNPQASIAQDRSWKQK